MTTWKESIEAYRNARDEAMRLKAERDEALRDILASTDLNKNEADLIRSTEELIKKMKAT